MPSPSDSAAKGHAAGALTAGEAYRRLLARFKAAGLDAPASDARLLLCHAAGLSAEQLASAPDRPLTADAAERLETLALERLSGKPVSRLLGRREFWSLDFELNAATLDPRPDTETLVELVLDKADANRPLRILDLGTGTGCILLALLSELPQASGIGLDVCEDAAHMAARNAARLGLSARAAFAVGDWLAPVSGGADLIVSNPPYIPDADLPRLMPEVAKFDPERALAGGRDGLDPYRNILANLPSALRTGGSVAFEFGAGQADALEALMRAAGLAELEFRNDLAGRRRAVIGRLAVGDRP